MGIAGMLNLIPLALFVIGSLAKHVPKHEELKSSAPEEERDDNFLFSGKKWVVLVAGSSGWRNYRHQADICHAYQIIRGNGIPEENIITMMVDDIAYNPENPTPGKIINRPDGEDVYDGVVIDYKGKDVNSANFLNIIMGNKTYMQGIGSEKVVDAGRFDRVFINFVDHGSTGLLAFPDDYLYADELAGALVYMYEEAKYKKLLLYIEACKSGSMFDGIIGEDTQILAVTAAGPRENSYACYCRSQSGSYRTCLGDLFSVTWMEELEATMYKSSASKRSVFNDFSVVRTNVTASNVMAYGDFRTGHEKLSAFIGYRKRDDASLANSTSKFVKRKMTTSNRDVYEDTLKRELSDKQLPSIKRHEYSQELRQNNKMRFVIDSVLRNIYSMTVMARPDVKDEIGDFEKPNHLDLTLDMFPCYRSILNKITEHCFSLPRNPYALDRLTIFANLCVADKQINQLVNGLVKRACSDVTKNINNVF